MSKADPRSLGLPFTVWSLSKLVAHLGREKICRISRETLRRILHTAGVSWQKTKTWKASTDPQFLAKMRRILDLYDRRPVDGRVICVDEFGPLNLQPPRFCAEALGGPGRPGARHSWASEETAIDPYRVLGVARDAPPEEVRGAY